MAFQGGCHCGAVRFEVDAALPDAVIECNCSHCRRKGFLLAFFPASVFTLSAGEDDLETYRFNTHKLAHRFCKVCGTQSFAEGVGKDGSAMRAVNVRCVPDVDIGALKIQPYNGASA